MTRLLALVAAVSAGITLGGCANTSRAKPDTASKTASPIPADRKAEAGVDCDKAVDHLFELGRAELKNKGSTTGEALKEELAEFDKDMNESRAKAVEGCYQDSKMTQATYGCVMSSTTVAGFTDCFH